LSNVCEPCGAAGQPACQYRSPNCDPGTNNLFGTCRSCGAPGQLTCTSGSPCGDNAKPDGSGLFCIATGHSAEPDTGVSSGSDPATGILLQQPAGQPVLGIADLHTHQFADLGFGGVLFHGESYDSRGIDSALSWCDFTHDFHTGLPSLNTILNGGSNMGPVLDDVPDGFGALEHGPGGYLDLVTLGLGGGSHSVSGTGDFSGWPNWNSVTHQQMYYKWLERAYLGGLRLMVVHAVSNKALCEVGLYRQGFNCEDMPAVDRELQAAKDLQDAIDQQSGGPGKGWYQIAYSPAQARDIIRSGKLAVILGIEVDDLFGCTTGSCTADDTEAQLQKYYDLGVRHIFPVHVFNNAFGGAALYTDLFNSGNFLVNRHHFQARDCSSEGYDYQIKTDLVGQAINTITTNSFVGADLQFLLNLEFQNINAPLAQYGSMKANCNAQGLTPLGSTLINQMMDLGIVIDTDHMSRLTHDAVEDIALQRSYPLVSGHSGYFDLSKKFDPGNVSEYGLTQHDLDLYKQLGGMVTIPVTRGPCDTTLDYVSKYRFVVGKMGGGPFDDGQHPGIAFSTDFNGLVEQTAPRFVRENCRDKGQAAFPALDYSAQHPIVVSDPATGVSAEFRQGFLGPLGGVFARQQTGNRVFDFNNDGLAHVGLVPDFFADLQNVGMTQQELGPMLNSAETYIQMWERIFQDPSGAPIVKPLVSGTLGQNGWYISDVQVTWDIRSATLVSRTGCDATTIKTDTSGVTLTCEAANAIGSASASVTIKRDASVPVVEIVLPRTNDAGWNNGEVKLFWGCLGSVSGVEPLGRQILTITGDGIWRSGLLGISSFENPSTVYNPTCTSGAGLSGSVATEPPFGFEAIIARIDTTPPEITFLGASPQPNAAGWNNTDVTVGWTCRDALSGLPSSSVNGLPTSTLLSTALSSVLSAEGQNQSASIACTDVAGNTATATAPVTFNIDKTPPAITATQLPAANSAGWNNTNVNVIFSASDSLSGVSGPSTTTSVLSGEGTGLSTSATFTDIAGNSTTSTYAGVNIDKTPPTISFLERLPGANANGWNNSNITASWACADVLSGATQPTISQTLSSEGADQSLTGSCFDVAGNVASNTVSGLNLDKTPPLIAVSQRVPAPNAAGWNNQNVTVTWSCTDSLSGAVVPAISQTLSTEGANQILTAICSDLADNSSKNTVTGLNLDKTPPVIYCAVSPAVLWPPDRKLAPVVETVALSDSLSGANGFSLTTATTSEGDPTADIAGFTLGSAATNGALRASRNGGTDRVYTLGYTGFDMAGNSSSCSTQVIVPQHQ
jgi:microsomal dipeptidase-like Zn-dependent dipeptidase